MTSRYNGFYDDEEPGCSICNGRGWTSEMEDGEVVRIPCDCQYDDEDSDIEDEEE